MVLEALLSSNIKSQRSLAPRCGCPGLEDQRRFWCIPGMGRIVATDSCSLEEEEEFDEHYQSYLDEG